MIESRIQTQRLSLVAKTLEESRAMIDAMTPEEKAQLSADWLKLVNEATSADPWIVGYSIIRKEDMTCVGQCGYKGPPADGGIVEIAYGISPEHEGHGYATEAAMALTSLAFGADAVRVVRAHTLPESSASTRILTKCGFRKIGEVVDPEDGLVWRWEKARGDDVKG